jgi:hypothetical protein
VIRRVIAAALAVALAACQAAPAPSVEPLDPRVSVGAIRTCAELGLSDIRCSLLKLRAAKALLDTHPGAVVESQELHEAGTPPAGQSAVPGSQVVAMVMVYVLDGGSRVSVPVLCPRDADGGDPACNPQVE